MIIYTGKDYYDVSRKAANIMSGEMTFMPPPQQKYIR